MKYTKRKNGLMMTTLRVEINLTKEEVDLLTKTAKTRGTDFRSLLHSAVCNGVRLELDTAEEEEQEEIDARNMQDEIEESAALNAGDLSWVCK